MCDRERGEQARGRWLYNKTLCVNESHTNLDVESRKDTLVTDE